MSASLLQELVDGLVIIGRHGQKDVVVIAKST